MKKGSAQMASMEEPSNVIQEFLDLFSTPDGLDDVVSLVEASSRLVEAAAFGAATLVDEKRVVELIRLAAELEVQAKKLRGIQLS